MIQLLRIHATLFTCALLIISLTACDKEDKEANPTITDESVCKITSLAYPNDTSPNLYEYNSKGYLTRIINKETQNDEDLVTHIFSYLYDNNNRLIKSEIHRDGVLGYYITYDYNGLSVTCKEYNTTGSTPIIMTYKYDAKNRVIEASEVSSGRYKVMYTYNLKDNLEKKEIFTDGSLSSKVFYFDYDNNPIPHSGVKGLPAFEGGLSKNNFGKAINYTYEDSNGDGVVEEKSSKSSTYVYEYNSKGYPVKSIRTDENGEEAVTSYNYDCNDI